MNRTLLEQRSGLLERSRRLIERDYLEEREMSWKQLQSSQVVSQILTFKKEERFIIDVPVTGTHSASEYTRLEQHLENSIR